MYEVYRVDPVSFDVLYYVGKRSSVSEAMQGIGQTVTLNDSKRRCYEVRYAGIVMARVTTNPENVS